jgi:beta-lactamase class A
MRRRRRANLEHILLLILLGMVALAVVHYVTYRQRFPRPLQVGDLVLPGGDEEATRERLQEAFSQHVTLRHLDQEVELDPNEVGFRLHTEQMLDERLTQPSAQLEAVDFLAVTLGGTDRPLALPVVADYDPQALWQELQAVAAQWDQLARPPRLVKAKLRFVPGEPARQLDIEASLPHVVAALLSPSGRQVDLVVIHESEGPSQYDMDLLRTAIEELLADFPGVAGAFVKDLATGEELAINGEVAFSGMSLMKIAIMEESFRQINASPTREETRLLSETMTVRGNYTSNLLLAEIGEGDPYLGARRLTESMRQTGLVNTFMAAPYYSSTGRPPPRIVTPANSRSDVDTGPDPYMQTTPQDIGLLMEMIYQGARGGGTLIAAYPGQITRQECQAMIELMKGNRIGSLIEEGLPEGIPIAHKHGWIDDTHADAGIVFSPAGDFVMVIFVHQRGWLAFEQSGPLIANIAHVVYNYFNMDDQW